MRALPDALVAAIRSGAAGLCTAWVLTRPDGVRLGFTDHDEALVVDGVACSAASGWTVGAAETRPGFEAGRATIAGALDDAALTEADIEAGLYDGAEVACLVLLWNDPAATGLVWRGRIARMVRTGAGFTARIEGPLHALTRVAGRTYGRLCDAALGDARCGVDLADPAFAGAVCDKRHGTCFGRFSNSLNFQGFPDLPGDDFLTVYPGAGQDNSGGSRRS